MTNKEFSEVLVKKGCHLFVSSSSSGKNNLLDKFFENPKSKGTVYVDLERRYSDVDNDVKNSCSYLVLSEESKLIKSNKILTVRDKTSLINISLVLGKLTTKRDVSWLFFDSIDKMVVLNEVYALKRFFSYLVKNLALKHVSGVFISLNSEQASRLVPHIQELFDNTHYVD